MPQDDRPQAHRVINVLVAVHIPSVTATASLREDWGHSLHELRGTFAKGLSTGRNQLPSLRLQFVGPFKASFFRFYRRLCRERPIVTFVADSSLVYFH